MPVDSDLLARNWERNAQRYAEDIVLFAEEQIVIPEGVRAKELVMLEPHQKEVLRTFFTRSAGLFPFSTYVYSEVKKSGKTFIGGLVALWVILTEPGRPEGYAIANDLEQSQGRHFRQAAAFIEANPILAQQCKIRLSGRQTITFPDGGHYTAIPVDYGGEAGANPVISTYDELWAGTSEKFRRLWAEFTVVPTRRNSIRFVTTYAGFTDESELLLDLYQKAVKPSKRIHPTLEIYAHDGLAVFWSHTPRMPWQVPAYYKQQKSELRPVDYRRLHENRWQKSKSAFLAPNDWDALSVDSPPAPTKAIPAYAYVDAAHKRDCVACILVGWSSLLGPVLLRHRIWYPPKGGLILPEATALKTILEEWHVGWNLKAVGYDPAHFETAGVILRRALAPAGVDVLEVPQTGENLLAMSSTLYDAIKFRKLLVYDAPDLRQHVLNVAAKEVPDRGGFKLTRAVESAKVDGALTLAGALRLAFERGPTDCRRGGGITFAGYRRG